LEAAYRVTPGRVRIPHLPHDGDASRLVPAAALKAVGAYEGPCAFDPRRLRHASRAWMVMLRALTPESRVRVPGGVLMRHVRRMRSCDF
jgi:hypothetical protein